LIDDTQVEKHYATHGITARVLAALRNVGGADIAITPETLAPIDHFHGRGVAATEELAALMRPKPSNHLLDIGCGIGGPARWIASRYGCRVTGVDLTPEFCDAAQELNALTGLSQQVEILQCSALSIPRTESTFDHAYSQAAFMNIADKLGVFREVFRILKPGGLLALSVVGSGAVGEPYYPLPWATTPAISYLVSPSELTNDLVAAGFEIELINDTTASVATALAPILRQLEREGLPPLGEHVVTGENAREWRANAMRSTVEGRLTHVEALARKPRSI
jgi:ubiquinone/menaquinone biosynthesis C-methylase UbiE